ISPHVSGGDSAGLLSGADAECVLRGFYDDPCLSSGYGGGHAAERNGSSGAYASDEKERSAQAEAERFHGGLPRDGGLPERAQKSFISCDCSHISSENRAVFRYVVCLPGVSDARHFLFECDPAAGGNFGCRGHAAAAGGNGHQ